MSTQLLEIESFRNDGSILTVTQFAGPTDHVKCVQIAVHSNGKVLAGQWTQLDEPQIKQLIDVLQQRIS
jgi:hypothetical protein